MQERMLVGLIGANIQKSLSPALFEDACAAADIKGHYHLMDMDRLPGRSLEQLLHAACASGFKGINITYPCKEAVIPLLDDLSLEARQIGAVNTVSICAKGRTTGHNTDRIGFRRAFAEQLGAERVRKAAMLVGAGGAGRAVAFALFDLGLRRLLVNDTNPEQAQSLVRTLVGAFGTDCARARDRHGGGTGRGWRCRQRHADWYGWRSPAIPSHPRGLRPAIGWRTSSIRPSRRR